MLTFMAIVSFAEITRWNIEWITGNPFSSSKSVCIHGSMELSDCCLLELSSGSYSKTPTNSTILFSLISWCSGSSPYSFTIATFEEGSKAANFCLTAGLVSLLLLRAIHKRILVSIYTARQQNLIAIGIGFQKQECQLYRKIFVSGEVCFNTINNI